tara:strand:- start:2417 stop:2665 length:249 start_codon:yes stop_codon:yes gene_type:complete
MPIFAQILLLVGFSCIVFSTALVFIFKHPNTSRLNLVAKGSFVFRNLQEHVTTKWVNPIYTVLYVGLGCILIAILGVLIVNV